MGRKDKLRREKQARQRKIENAAPVATTTTTATIAQATSKAATTMKVEDFPKSESYVQALMLIEGKKSYGINIALSRGATEYGCVHSMNLLGQIHMQPNNIGRLIHLGQPWVLEGALRGSFYCAHNLVVKVYDKAAPRQAASLITYWMKMHSKYMEWSGACIGDEQESTRKSLKDNVVKQCAICFKQDTEILTLRQCMGCSMYCYCSQECQTIHYNEHKHGSECRQLQILNKYHKPYAKEIRKAAICGESHQALEKLRHKLGLTRPVEEYQQFRDTTTNIYKGRPINPYEFLIARKDGTVWIGSTPMNPLGSSV